MYWTLHGYKKSSIDWSGELPDLLIHPQGNNKQRNRTSVYVPYAEILYLKPLIKRGVMTLYSLMAHARAGYTDSVLPFEEVELLMPFNPIISCICVPPQSPESDLREVFKCLEGHTLIRYCMSRVVMTYTCDIFI